MALVTDGATPREWIDLLGPGEVTTSQVDSCTYYEDDEDHVYHYNYHCNPGIVGCVN